MKKRMISVLLILALALSLLPAVALADDDSTVRVVKTSGDLIAALADGNVTTIRLLGTEEVLLKKIRTRMWSTETSFSTCGDKRCTAAAR